MANLSLRGLDRPTLSRLKSKARSRGVSVNRLIVETLRRQYAGGGQAFDDLDRLVGAWTRTEGAAFDTAVAPFAEIDASLWAAEPGTAYRAKRPARRKTGK